MTQSTNIAAGDVVAGRYRIEGVIGHGGCGAVYEACRLSSGDRVALKIMLVSYGTSETDAARFRREAALVQKLRHPCVVDILDFGTTDKGSPFIAFELLRGRALNDVLRKDGPLPVERVCEISRDVLEALDAAHSMGIVHRDIKPGNVFLCEDGAHHGRSKVLDFGVAKALTGEESLGTQLTQAGQMIGTPHYMSPEQVRGGEISPTTDLYALGLVMAEMLTGQRVVDGDALIEIYMSHISDSPTPLPPEVQRSILGPLIRRATAKAVAERYGSAIEMLAALCSVMGASAAGPSSIATTAMPSRKPPAPPSGAKPSVTGARKAGPSSIATTAMPSRKPPAPPGGAEPKIDLGETIPMTNRAASREDQQLEQIGFTRSQPPPAPVSEPPADSGEPPSAAPSSSPSPSPVPATGERPSLGLMGTVMMFASDFEAPDAASAGWAEEPSSSDTGDRVSSSPEPAQPGSLPPPAASPEPLAATLADSAAPGSSALPGEARISPFGPSDQVAGILAAAQLSVPPPPPQMRSSGSKTLIIIVIAVALAAAVITGVLLWAPWS